MLPLDRSPPSLLLKRICSPYFLSRSVLVLQSYSSSLKIYSHLVRAQTGIFQRHLIFPNSTSSSMKEKLLLQLISTGFLLATRYLGVLLATRQQGIFLATRQQGILLATRQQGVLLATGACGGNQLQDRALPNDSPFQAICLPYVVNVCRIYVALHKAIAT